ncbi:MAG: exosortase E/protease, VPEID-CTERM system [Gemmataceae bacterium]|nr:exosortase E/protease, VPEID-CTERM system [Gemmataceae bacterium]
MAALLLIEIVLLSLRFDAQSLVGRTDPWALAMLQVPWLTRLGLLVALIAALFTVLRRDRRPLPIAPPAGRRMAIYLILHLISLGLFTRLTAFLLEGTARQGNAVELWVATWAALGVSVLLFWAASLVAPWQWLALGRKTWPTLATGVGVATLVWGASHFTGELWSGLGAATFHVSAALLRLIAPDIVCLPEQAVVGTPTFQVEIASACSGYEGLALIAAFLSAYLWLFRRELRFPHALLLLPVGMILIWFANAVRIALLVAIGTWVSPAVALGGFHSQAGWLAFLAVALGLAVASRWLRLFHAIDKGPASPVEASSSITKATPTTAYLLPLLVLLLAQMLTTALTDGIDRLLPFRVLGVAGVLLYCRRAYERPLWNWSWGAAALGVVVFGLWMLLEPLYQASGDNDMLPTQLSSLPPWVAATWLGLRVLQSVVLVPLAEELAFRGYLLRRLIAADFLEVSPRRFTLLSFVISSLLFGLLHGRWLAGTLCGMLFAFAVYRRGRLADAILAHAVANALIAACVLLGGAWYLWN